VFRPEISIAYQVPLSLLLILVAQLFNYTLMRSHLVLPRPWPKLFLVGCTLCFFAQFASAQTGTFGPLTYTDDGTSITITDFDNSVTDVVIPETIDGKPVVAIGVRAFIWGVPLSKVSIPSSVTSIDSQAFHGCRGLVSIDVDPQNPVYMSLDGVLIDKVSNELMVYPPQRPDSEYVIPITIDSINKEAFEYCEFLTSVIIPDTFTSLDSAFINCRSLISIVIPESVTSLEGAFNNCFSLTNVTIPDGVTSLDGTFRGCHSLTTVAIPDGITSLYDTFIGCSALTSVPIPDSVRLLDGTFYNCTSLTTVTIPDSVVRMDSAFRGCSALTSVTIPDGVRSLSGTFYNCTSLKSIVIPDGVSSLNRTFDGCSALTSVVIPDSVTSLSGTFINCTSLTSVKIPHYVAWLSDTFNGCHVLRTVTMPNGIRITNRAFWRCSSLESVYITGSSERISIEYEDDSFSDSVVGLTFFARADSEGFTTPTWNGFFSATIPVPSGLGSARLDASGWIYHLERGYLWMEITGDFSSEQGMPYWSAELGTWLWSRYDIYPWVYQAEFGWISFFGDSDWMWHHEHGFIFLSQTSDWENGMRYWDAGLGSWLWTHSGIYPWVHASGALNGWLYYAEGGTPDERYFNYEGTWSLEAAL
jgi:hypothetical protein